MRLFLLLIFLLPTVLLGTGTRVPVQVMARVPLIAAVDGPGQVVLAPGGVARIEVSVVANVPWVLAVHSPNAWVSGAITLSGPPGGATANRREVEIGCSSQAAGPQTITLIYTLMPR